jgi:YbbR domain-containing protein
MPFQDVEEVSTTEYSGPPGAFEAWLRKIFIEDWGLKLLALAITLLLWLAVTGVNQPVTIRTSVQLNFIRPDKMEISNDPPRTVDVLLTGRRSKLDSIKQLDLVATVDVSDLHEGERVVRLSSDRVEMELPDGVKIDAFQPSIVPVHLEPIIERQIEVDVKLDGKPEDGYEVYSIRSSPGKIRVRGPAGRVNGLEKAPTETISLEGKKEGFTATNTAIDISDPKIDLLDSVVDVTVEIGERREERTFTGVTVTSGPADRPLTAAVTVVGPASVISQLKLNDLKIVLTTGTLEPRLSLPAEIQDRVTLKSIKPSQFSVPR